MPPPSARVDSCDFNLTESRLKVMSEPVQILRSVLLVVYIGTLVAVALYGFHRYVLVFLYMKHRNHGYQPKATFPQNNLPRVTIQLPMYNEDSVAERVIKATCL